MTMTKVMMMTTTMTTTSKMKPVVNVGVNTISTVNTWKEHSLTIWIRAQSFLFILPLNFLCLASFPLFIRMNHSVVITIFVPFFAFLHSVFSSTAESTSSVSSLYRHFHFHILRTPFSASTYITHVHTHTHWCYFTFFHHQILLFSYTPYYNVFTFSFIIIKA